MRFVLTIFLFSCCLRAGAQNFNEWFRQKATQRNYLIQQIAALEVYKGYVKAGYRIVDGGLSLIGDIKNGDFSLHKDYFGSLAGVSPSVRRYSRVAAILAAQLRVMRQMRAVMANCRASGMFTPSETGYLEKVLKNVLQDCTNLLDELAALLQDGRTVLTDKERLDRIDAIYRSMQDNEGFIATYGSEAIQLALGRSKEVQGIHWIKKHYKAEKD